MPKGKTKSKFPHLYGSVPSTPPVADATNDQVRDLLAPGKDEDFAASLPESTVTASTEEKPRKAYTRKPKTVEENLDPLMSDPQYKRAIGNMSGLGGAQVVKVGFSATGKPLNETEASEIDDLFYVIGKRSKMDPGSSWLILGLYSFLLLCRLVVMRTDVGEHLSKLFEQPQPQETETKKEEPVN